MKLVKFKNGKYGVRKWDWLFGYMYAVNKSGVWRQRDADFYQEFTKDFALEVLEDMKRRKSALFDIGRAIKEK